MKEIPYMATELVKLEKEYSETPKESETEWRVSLSWSGQILLLEKETRLLGGRE